MRYGYKASAEQFGPRELLEYSVLAEQVGFDTIAVSDHFQPWRHNTGHAPNALVWLGALGQATERATMVTSVLTPTLRYHPSIVAQAFGTLAQPRPRPRHPRRGHRRVDERDARDDDGLAGREGAAHAARRGDQADPAALDRRARDLRGRVLRRRARPRSTTARASRSRSTWPPPGPLAAKLAGRAGDGFICTSGKPFELYEELLGKVREGAEAAGRDADAIDRMIEIKVSYDRDPERAEPNCHWWAALALTGEEKSGVEDPLEMERLADANLDRAHTRFIVTSDPEECVERIRPYVELGFTRLVFHGPGNDQRRFLEQFSEDVLPLLRERFGAAAEVTA